MEQKFYDAMADCPVIAAVKNVEGIERCLESDVKIVFVLFGNPGWDRGTGKGSR